jgi:hypothetical protein
MNHPMATNAVPTMIGEVTKTEFRPMVLPTFDDAFEIVVRRVAASWSVPSLDPGEVTVSKLNPGEASFDEATDPTVTKLDWSNRNA